MKKWCVYMCVVPYQDAFTPMTLEQRAEQFDDSYSAEIYARNVFQYGLSPRAGTILRVMSVKVEEIEAGGSE